MKRKFCFGASIVILLFTLVGCNKEFEELSKVKEVELKAASASYDLWNWMSLLSDNTNLAHISMPGAHDACALYEPFSGTAKCQNLSLSDQYNVGVRFVDIRCRHINNAFAIHHGQVYQNMNFDNVLNATINFLNNNPSECVVMSVKEEYNPENNTRSFEETFNSYVAKNPGKWYLGSTIPDLSQVRGKIVLLRRFGASAPKGLDASYWPDNTTFTINGDANIRVQDNYKVSDNDTKWDRINALLTEANSDNYSTLFLNFTSGVKTLFFGIPSIPYVSNNINPRVYNYFGDNTSGRYGAVIMDFVDQVRCQRIVDTNFPIASGIYSVVSKQSNLALDDPNFSHDEGTKIIVWHNTGTSNQKWEFIPTGGGFYTIINQESMLAIDGGPNNQGTLLWQWGVNYTPAQQWLLRPSGNGFNLISQQTGLAIDGAANVVDAYIQLWELNNSDNQIWYIQ
jgi:1-phosphatidylinositol phosphodiesterase